MLFVNQVIKGQFHKGIIEKLPFHFPVIPFHGHFPIIPFHGHFPIIPL